MSLGTNWEALLLKAIDTAQRAGQLRLLDLTAGPV